MKKIIKFFKNNINEIILISFFSILVLAFLIFDIVTMIVYKDTPIDEIPSWVLWFWFNK